MDTLWRVLPEHLVGNCIHTVRNILIYFDKYWLILFAGLFIALFLCAIFVLKEKNKNE
jgi:ABC-type dipeptide/oligopeptide/nickel transport system permease subunit